jgi:hypothetical protein
MIYAGTSNIRLKGVLGTPSKNSYVYKLGFRYAIIWYKQSQEIEQNLAKTFGPAAKSYHFYTYSSTPKVKSTFAHAETYRWYYGPRRWNENNKYREHWAVFKTDKDRTLSLLTI